MRTEFQLITRLLLILAFLTACNPSVKKEELPAFIDPGQTYYTQVALHFEKNHFSATNYGVGMLLPINTAMQFKALKGKYILTTETTTGREFKFSNNPKHTGKTIEQTFQDLLGPHPVNLGRFTSLEQSNIEAGTVARGMSKEAVLKARGYPPAIGTASLDSDEWKYWWNRWQTYRVIFENDKVIDITQIGEH